MSSLEEAVLPLMGRGSVFLRKFEEFHSIAGVIQLSSLWVEADSS